MTRSNLNTSYHSLQKVQRHLDENKLHVHKVRPKDKHNYKSNTYQVWYLVYDSNHLPVQYFYQCKGCDVLAKFKLSNGNYQMRRHPCFQAWLKNHEAQKKKHSSWQTMMMLAMKMLAMLIVAAVMKIVIIANRAAVMKTIIMTNRRAVVHMDPAKEMSIQSVNWSNVFRKFAKRTEKSLP